MPRVLVIEDTELVRTIYRDILEDAGYDVIEAADGEEGIRSFRENGADLVITDIVMSGKGGAEVIRELRRDSPGTQFLAVSGRAPGDALRDLAAGGVPTGIRILTKPVRREDLLTAVEALVGTAFVDPSCRPR